MSRIAALINDVNCYSDATSADASEVQEAAVVVADQTRLGEALDETITALESLYLGVEATAPEEFTAQSRVLVAHAQSAIYNRLGYAGTSASLESSQEDFRTVSLEGLGSAIAAIWKGIIDGIKAAIKAIGNFFKKLLGFKKDKTEEIKKTVEELKALPDQSTAPAKAIEHSSDELKKKADEASPEDAKKIKDSKYVVLTKSQAALLGGRQVSTEAAGDDAPIKVSMGGHTYYLVLKETLRKKMIVDITGPAKTILPYAALTTVQFVSGPQGSFIDPEDLTSAAMWAANEKKALVNNLEFSARRMTAKVDFAEKTFGDYRPGRDYSNIVKIFEETTYKEFAKFENIFGKKKQAENKEKVDKQDSIFIEPITPSQCQHLLEAVRKVIDLNSASAVAKFNSQVEVVTERWKKLADKVGDVDEGGKKLEAVIRRAALKTCVTEAHKQINDAQRLGGIEVNLYRLGHLTAGFALRVAR